MTPRRKSYDLATDHAAGRAWREAVALIGGLIILFNIAAGLAAGLAVRDASPMLAELDGEHFVICTGAGMIVVDRDGKPTEQKRGGAPQLCPYCVPLMQGCADAPAAVALAAEPVAGQPVETPPYEVFQPRLPRLIAAAQPRAPPA